MQNCCCAKAVSSIWRDLLPTEVRSAIATMDLKTHYQSTLDAADAVWNATRTKSIATVTVATAAATDKAQSDDPQDVAAFRPRNQRGRGSTSRGPRGAQSNGSRRGQPQHQRRPLPARKPHPHPDGPPPDACNIHWNHGKSAFNCLDRINCPWREHIAPRPN